MSDAERPVVRPSYTYEGVQELIFALEELLVDYDIPIKSGSKFERSVLSVLDIVYRKQGDGKVPITEDVRTAYRDLIGTSELSGLILAVRDHPSFASLLPHLRIINDGAALQNLPSSPTDQATNKLFELFAAALAMQCGADVTLDDPDHSHGDNPDVLATIQGDRWGIACKVLHSTHSEGFVQHLEKGIDQIDKSPAQVGVVMFNLRNVIDHDRYWPMTDDADVERAEGPEFGCFLDPQRPFEMLLQEINLLGTELKAYLPDGYLEGVFQDTKSVPGFYLWAHTASGVTIDGMPTATSVRAGLFVRALPITDKVTKVLQCLHWAVFVDSPNRPPCPLDLAT